MSVRTLTKFVKQGQCQLRHLTSIDPPNDRLLPSALISRGFMNQIVKKITKNQQKLVSSDQFPVIKPSEKQLIINEPKTPRLGAPLVLLFGWAGASHKNLSKYSEIYLKTGCTTCQYILSTRYFVFKITHLL